MDLQRNLISLWPIHKMGQGEDSYQFWSKYLTFPTFCQKESGRKWTPQDVQLSNWPQANIEAKKYSNKTEGQTIYIKVTSEACVAKGQTIYKKVTPEACVEFGKPDDDTSNKFK